MLRPEVGVTKLAKEVLDLVGVKEMAGMRAVAVLDEDGDGENIGV